MDINQINSQMKVLQDKLQKIQNELKQTLVKGEAGAGLVKVELFALGHEVSTIAIDDSLISSNNKEMITDLLISAFNTAVRNADKVTREKMASLPFDLGDQLRDMGGAE